MTRNRWLSALLSFLTPGLGQVYNGQIKKGIILYLLPPFTVLIVGLWTILLPLKVIGVLFCCFLSLCVAIYIIGEAFITAQKIGDNFILRPYNKWQVYIVIWLVSAFLLTPIYYKFGIRTFLIQAYKIPSETMIPTLEIGDHIFADKFCYRNAEPKRKDLIIFKYPEDPRRDFIKRVIGLPGEKIMVKNKKVYINGKELIEPYKIHTDVSPVLQSPRDDLEKPIIISQNHYFVLGDNRDLSLDSRFWGTVPKELIKGKAFMIYWPPGRIKELY